MSEPATPRIQVQLSAADPGSARFVLGRSQHDGPHHEGPLHDGPPVLFRDAASAAGAPLAAALFALHGVREVHVADDIVTIAKSPDIGWDSLKRAIADAIRAALATGAPALGDATATAFGPRDDATVRAAVQAILDQQANPAIASHGGHVGIADLRDGVLGLRMSGGCQGCAASAATLHDAVARMIRAAVPEVARIVDVTDHAAGTNPYYADPQAGGQAGAQSPRALLHRPVPPDAILWEDEQFNIAPDYLAPRLGLTPDSLRAALHAGEVVSRSETGTGGDAGRIRLIVRHGHRAWAAEIGSDGAAREIPPPPAAIEAADAEARAQVRVQAGATGH